MTTRASQSSFLPILANVLAAYAVVHVAAVTSLAHAEPASPPSAATASAQPTKTEKPEKKRKATRDRPATGNAKPAARAAKSAKAPVPPVTAAKANDTPTASAKPSQVVDFDTDQVEGQRLEPGFELIEGAPAKARHRSLVEPLKPGDSVVHRE